ncbi:PREDICTED: netrin receptor DCC-like [Amphimedon queenslandica]|uniref:Fibronectin type-III domain-containing protein n=1 Tax=Amphimedon queenslandica TaxID=400682 RepID=A0AAN0JS29_AMPQE|nr:PREDICTED: netrin receptor DCC-like [Amphimedon queenslandica]|eukprot:XP_019859684.1 PREDICTED: netrin receptor DCC-like [Amphimedon queenslandica]
MGPTTVSCSVNGTGISTELSRVIVNGSGSVTRVTVTVRQREAGDYQCTVYNARVTNGPISGNSGPTAVTSTSLLNISVSDTPTGLTATRLSTGLAQVRLSWSTVSGATGYEVYYQLSSDTPVSVSNTSYTTINITSGLIRRITYTFYVVSYGSVFLPSGNASVMETLSDPVVNDLMSTVITSTSITLTWSPPTAVVPISYNIKRRCRRVCGSSFTSTSEISVSSPHASTGISPYSQCDFDLSGVYGAEIADLTTNYSATTLSNVPTAPVDDIIFSSVESVSMTVSWDEVPCNGRTRQKIQSTPDESKPSIAIDLTSATILASSTSKIIVSYSTETTTMTTALTTPLATPLATVSTTVLVDSGGTITGWIVGVTVLASLLAVSIIIILVLVVYNKRANIKQKSLQFHRKSDKEIEMECSPAYTTNTADDLSMKDSPTYMYATVQEAQSTDEPIYDTAGPESIYSTC